MCDPPVAACALPKWHHNETSAYRLCHPTAVPRSLLPLPAGGDPTPGLRRRPGAGGGRGGSMDADRRLILFGIAVVQHLAGAALDRADAGDRAAGGVRVRALRFFRQAAAARD